jgi:uncharacterized ubiquitin-like protein YukD
MTIAVLNYAEGVVDIRRVPEYMSVEKFLKETYHRSSIEWMEVITLNIEVDIK